MDNTQDFGTPGALVLTETDVFCFLEESPFLYLLPWDRPLTEPERARLSDCFFSEGKAFLHSLKGKPKELRTDGNRGYARREESDGWTREISAGRLPRLPFLCLTESTSISKWGNDWSGMEGTGVVLAISHISDETASLLTASLVPAAWEPGYGSAHTFHAAILRMWDSAAEKQEMLFRVRDAEGVWREVQNTLLLRNPLNESGWYAVSIAQYGEDDAWDVYSCWQGGRYVRYLFPAEEGGVRIVPHEAQAGEAVQPMNVEIHLRRAVRCCDALLTEEMNFCPWCGREKPHRRRAETRRI